jgi:hypothetical protein
LEAKAPGPVFLLWIVAILDPELLVLLEGPISVRAQFPRVRLQALVGQVPTVAPLADSKMMVVSVPLKSELNLLLESSLQTLVSVLVLLEQDHLIHPSLLALVHF